jgi:predicted GNAT superfamily acetyltransferase
MPFDPYAFEKTRESGGRVFKIKIETSSRPEEYAKYDRLREAIWRFPEDHLAGTRNLMCENFINDGSTLFLPVYAVASSGRMVEDEEHLVGFTYGFIGIRDKSLGFTSPGNLFFYAQYAGVRPGFEGFGLGVWMKECQREVVLGWGIDEVVCTFDPLAGVNARRNIHHFGMTVREYREATFGSFGGRLNREDIPTDRFFMSWDLNKPAAGPETGESGFPPDARRMFAVADVRVRGRSGEFDFEVVRSESPEGDDRFVLVRIPTDFYLMLRETDVDDPAVRRIPLDWRLRTRRAFLELFGRGYRIVDFIRGDGPRPENAYLLEKSGMVL